MRLGIGQPVNRKEDPCFLTGAGPPAYTEKPPMICTLPWLP
jgi:hypothetical protein